MKRWAILILTFAMPLSSPMACGGDGCLRSSDCTADKQCSSAGQCVLREAPAVEIGGAGGEDSTPTTGGSVTSGSGGSAGVSGKGGSAGASQAGTSSDDHGGAGAGGEGGAIGGEGGAAAGAASDISLGGAKL